MLLTPLPLIVLVNAAQAGGSRRPGLRLAGEAVILLLPGLVVVLGILYGLAALGTPAAGPGAIDVKRLTGAAASHAGGVPLPREDDGQRVRAAAISTMGGVREEDDALARVG